MDSRAVKFESFNPETDNWDIYLDRLKFCFVANGLIADETKRANFFTVCGARVYEILLALITPKSAYDITFDEIQIVLTRHFSPKSNEISLSFKFYKRDQKCDESAAEYIAQLRRLRSGCNFSDLERMLRDRLVCGMRDDKLQYELLKRDNLLYQDVVDAMLSSESAGRDVRMIQEYAGVSSSSLLPTETTVTPMDINAFQAKTDIRLCYHCGSRHSGECRFIKTVCRYCKMKGHMEKVCIKKKKNTRNINFTEESEDRLNGVYCVKANSRIRTPPFEVDVLMAGLPVRMQVDTGASFSIVNERTREELRVLLPPNVLRRIDLSLRTWTETPVRILGNILLPVEYKDKVQNLCAIVAKGSGPNLLGRDWFAPFNITMNINFVSSSSNIINTERILMKYKEIFKDGLGTYRGHPVAIHLKPGATPKFLKARPVSFAIKERVEKEIDRLEGEGVLRPTSYSEWATPVVPIVKKSGEIRLCGDYRSTVNESTESDTYPMPTANEVFATVAGGKIFTTLDLDRAYTQVVVNEDTSRLLTLNTCKGLYTVHRLAFGVKACPDIFQRLMTSLLAGISGVAVLIDDIIISGRTMEEMLVRLDAVLRCIEQAGLRLNKNKCKFAREQYVIVL